MLNVRLNEELEKKLKQYSDQTDLSKSSIVKEALAQYFSAKEKEASPYALGTDLFGLAGSGKKDLSITYKDRLKAKLSEKHTH
ncbi:MAG: ribbon-helix-helix protein, CopG family [Cyclobacteriaceae bacterium]